jgi:prepilin-type N-terminal cleavage/methylation domain-containing protein
MRSTTRPRPSEPGPIPPQGLTAARARNSGRRSREGGFTLVEVLVALGIASGALILVLSANNASLAQSVQAREGTRLTVVAESKFEECRSGAEKAVSGDLAGFPRWQWVIYRTPSFVGGLRNMERGVFAVRRPDGTKALEWTAFERKGRGDAR